ncbi:MAG: zinc-dependent alcohol dehydrogenase family protein [Actinomycetes bacterium]
MRGAFLPGGRRVELRDVAAPVPAAGQVLVRPRASTICGSDVRAIYREHLGSGPEAYQDVIAGHEPCGDVVAVGDDVRRIRVGQRVVVYHISGCGQCEDCRRGYQISCTSDRRAAYGWQRDGGHADLLLAEERDLLVLPDFLSYVDGACVACGGGTAYEALCRADVSGRDAVLVTGLGPVGLMTGLLAKALGAVRVVGTDPVAGRREVALGIGAVDDALDGSDEDAVVQALGPGAEVAVDCSGSTGGRASAVRHARRWGRVVLVGEGGRLDVDASEQLLHRAVTVIGSWVTSTVRMAELLDVLDRHRVHLDVVVTEVFDLADVAEAYAVADAGRTGKVGVVQGPWEGRPGSGHV